MTFVASITKLTLVLALSTTTEFAFAKLGDGGGGGGGEKKKAISDMTEKERSLFQQRIVGGNQVTSEGIYEFYASWEGGCGGSLIHPQWVLSAAHCGGFGATQVVVNAYELDNNNLPVEASYNDARTAAQEFPHPDYNANSMRNDVLLIKLNEASTKTPIELNRDATIPSDNQNVMVIGLGTTSSGGSQPDFLREVIVKAIDDNTCNTDYYSGEVEEDVMFCAASPNKDSCQGDSGGPIFTLDPQGNPLKQVGVVSWGYGCADPQYPGVYAELSVAGIKDWIDCTICRNTNTGEAVDECNRCDGNMPTPTQPTPTQSPPTPTNSPPTNDCLDTPGWSDDFGDGCDWYEDNNACGDYNMGEMENCCICKNSGPTPTSTPPPPPTDDCVDTPGWKDEVGDDCKWYEDNDECGQYDLGELENCCYCKGAQVSAPAMSPVSSPVSFPVEFPTDSSCIDEPGWTDSFGDDCSWYDASSCGSWGEGEMEACCVCGGGRRIRGGSHM